MKTRKTLSAFLAVLALCVAPLAAQGSSRSATATAQIHVDGQLTLATTVNMNFGTVFSNAGVVASASVPTQATWAGSVSAGANLSVSIAVPSSLSDGVGHSLSFACGSTSGFIQADASGTSTFNPSTGLSSFAIAPTSSGAFSIHLGQDAGTASCSVDVGSLQSGGLFKSYSGNIVATVTVL